MTNALISSFFVCGVKGCNFLINKQQSNNEPPSIVSKINPKKQTNGKTTHKNNFLTRFCKTCLNRNFLKKKKSKKKSNKIKKLRNN